MRRSGRSCVFSRKVKPESPWQHSFFLSLFCKVLKKIAKYIQEQNEKIYAPRGLLITDPIERGMRVVSSPTVQANSLAFICAPQMELASFYPRHCSLTSAFTR